MRYWLLMVMMLSGGVWAAPEVQVVKQALVPGGFFVGKVVPEIADVTFNGNKVKVAEDGTFVVGFDRFADLQQRVTACVLEACTKKVLTLEPRTYKVQKVVGVPAKTVDPDVKDLARIKADTVAIAAARKKTSDGMAFAGDFVLPVKAETSGVYGSRRTYNGKERNWHKGHDLAAPTGTPVRAPADGVVILARDTFMNGNLILLDHGYGVTSLYAHLSAMDVKVGQVVQQGEVIGAVGTTGRSTGPHLHWGISWGNVAIDPILWVGHTSPQ